MVSTYSPNINIEEPARGDQVGTWDTPVNNNSTLIDLILGGITTISGAAGSVVLSAAQYQSKTITLNSTLLASITVTFPTSFKKTYEIYNSCTGSSLYVITLATTAAGGQVVCAPPGESVNVVNDGTNIRFHNLGRVGSYWDYAGSSVPAWVSGCTMPPYVNCDGSALSSATYPILFGMIGGTLPDMRGRIRMAVDGGAGRVSSAVSGFAPNTVGAAGGAQSVTLGASQIPTITSTGTITVVSTTGGYYPVLPFGHSMPNAPTPTNGTQYMPYDGTSNGGFLPGTQMSGSNALTYTNSSQAAVLSLQPTVVAGLTMIRAG